jgi:hypothetical protein
VRLYFFCPTDGHRVNLALVATSRRQIDQYLHVTESDTHHVHDVSPDEIYAEAITPSTGGGAVLGGIIGLLGGPIGAIVGAALGGAVGSKADQAERDAVARFNRGD